MFNEGKEEAEDNEYAMIWFPQNLTAFTIITSTGDFTNNSSLSYLQNTFNLSDQILETNNLQINDESNRSNENDTDWNVAALSAESLEFPHQLITNKNNNIWNVAISPGENLELPQLEKIDSNVVSYNSILQNINGVLINEEGMLFISEDMLKVRSMSEDSKVFPSIFKPTSIFVGETVLDKRKVNLNSCELTDSTEPFSFFVI